MVAPNPPGFYKGRRMLRVLLTMAGCLFLGTSLKAQTVFSVDYKSDADVKVYVAKYKSDAKKKIFFVDYKSDADLVVFFADYKSDAGWKNSGKKHLMY